MYGQLNICLQQLPAPPTPMASTESIPTSIHQEGKPKENQFLVFSQLKASWEPFGCLPVLLSDAVAAGQVARAAPGWGDNV